MFERLRTIFNLDSIQDNIVKYNQLKDELDFQKGLLDDIVGEYNERSIQYLQQKNHFNNELEKGIDSSSVVLDRIKSNFTDYFNSYINKVADIKKEIEKATSDMLRIENSDKNFIEMLNQYNISKSYETLKIAYRNKEITGDILEKAIKGITGKKKVEFADCIIRNQDGDILLLLRRRDSGKFPGEYGLPGGHVDPNESFQQAAIRECEEETGLKVSSCEEVYILEKGDCVIKYFDCKIINPIENPYSSEITVLLDSDEHINYMFMNKGQWNNEDIIGDLKKVLNELFIDDIEKNAIEILKSHLGQEAVEQLLKQSVDGSK